jgi:hypothetical protein
MTRPARRRLSLPRGLAVALALAVALVGVALWFRQAPPAEEASAGAAAPSAGRSAPSGKQPAPATAAPDPVSGQSVAMDPPAKTDGGDVDVVITQGGWGPSGTAVEVSGYVAGVVENGGTCRVTLSRDGETVSAEHEGLADATTTACGAIEVGDEDMTSGWWRAVLSYESPTSTGASAPTDVLVPTR